MSRQTDDPENPELGADFFARARRGLDHVPGPMRTTLLGEQAHRRGRGPQRAPTKQLVSLRLDPDVVAAYRSTGPGWQGRINAVLRTTVRTKPLPHVTHSVLETAPARRLAVGRKAAKKR